MIPLGKDSARRLQGLEGAGFKGRDVAVVDGGRSLNIFFLGHRREQACSEISRHPFLAQQRAILAQVRDQFAQQLRGGALRARSRRSSRRQSLLGDEFFS